MEDKGNEGVITCASPIIGALVGFAIAYWVWPWLGPQMFQPCPQWTSLGIGLYTGWHAFKALGERFRTLSQDDIKRRLSRLESRRPL